LPKPGRGKPSPAVELVPEYAYGLGLSVTTDSVGMAVVDFTGKVLGQCHEATPGLDRVMLVQSAKRQMQSLLRAHRISRERVFGVGVAMTGFFVGERRQVNPPEPLDDLALVDLDALLEHELALPVWLDNDGTMAAVAESMLGAGRWAQSFLYIYFSRGLGGGLVIDGKVNRGTHGNAGEVAGMLASTGLPVPTLELLRQMLAEDGIQQDDVGTMLQALNPHWPACDRWVTQAQPSLSLVVSAAVALVDPQAIVFGGRLPRVLAERLIAGLTIDNRPRRGRKRPEPRLVPAEAPGDATAIGAALLPFKDHFFL
jgi:predicted NBD/HSP70 family sugar kinase